MQITREFLGLRMRNFQGIAFIWTQAYREIFKSALVYLQELYEHVLLYLVLLKILMNSKKEGGGSTKVSGQISLRNSKIFCQCSLTVMVVIQFAINLDFSKTAGTWKRKLKNIFSGLLAKWNKFLSLTVLALFVVFIFWYILRKIKQIKQTRGSEITIWGPSCCYSLKVRSKL